MFTFLTFVQTMAKEDVTMMVTSSFASLCEVLLRVPHHKTPRPAKWFGHDTLGTH